MSVGSRGPIVIDTGVFGARAHSSCAYWRTCLVLPEICTGAAGAAVGGLRFGGELVTVTPGLPFFKTPLGRVTTGLAPG